jgi:DNA-binding NarL/FixJ family response regulator
MNLEIMIHYKKIKMKTQSHNLLLLEDNKLSSNRIVSFLERRFPNSLLISTFQTSEELLKAINKDSTIVVLDYDLKGEKSELLVREIKIINPKTEVIVLATDNDIAEAIETYKKWS